MFNGKDKTDLGECPYVARKCVGVRCRAWTTVSRTNEKGEKVAEFETCGETYQTQLMQELLNSMRHTEAHAGAAIQQYRESAVAIGETVVHGILRGAAMRRTAIEEGAPDARRLGTV